MWTSPCRDCPGRRERCIAAEIVGEGEPEVVFVGESPGRDELRVGRPMIGPFGDLVRQMANHYGEGRTYALTNVVGCTADPTPEHVATCQRRMWEELERWPDAPRVALGTIATQVLTGAGGITAVDGTWQPSVMAHRDTEWVLCLSIVVARNVNAFPAFDLGFRKAFSEPVLPITPNPAYEVITDVSRLEELADGDVACDVESSIGNFPDQTITEWGFCDEKENIFIIPHDALYEQRERLAEWLDMEWWRLGWHNGGNFDIPLIEAQLGFTPRLDWDTIIEHYALCETGLGRLNADYKDTYSRGHGLKLLAQKYLNWASYDENVVFGSLDPADVERRQYYLACDVLATMRLHKLFTRKLREEYENDA